MKEKTRKDGKLNSQQWKVYEYIKANPNCKASDIAFACDYEFDIDGQERKLSRVSHALFKDIEFINNSPEIEKCIIWSEDSVYKVASNYEEVQQFVNRIYRKSALKKLYKASVLVKKSRLDGQGKLISCKGDPITDESKARRFVEAFDNILYGKQD